MSKPPNLLKVIESSRKKRFLRIIPMLIFIYLVNFLDRTNISYAINAGMFPYLGVPSKEVGIIAGFASSLFFVGYFIPQIFSNLGINKYGVRKIFLLAAISWGLITVTTGFVTSVLQVEVLRFLLGIVEAPFFPGVMFYLSLWFLKDERATANGLYLIGAPVAGIIGGLIAGEIFAVYGNYPGWRYLFWYEGALAIIAGILAYIFLTDSPREAKWLIDEEKKALENAFKDEENEKVKVKWTRALANADVILLAVVYFLAETSAYGYFIWLPSIITSIAKVNAAVASFLSVIPYVIASISLVLIGMYSDKHQNHKIVTVTLLILEGGGLALSALTYSIYALSFALITIAAISIFGFLSPFWAVPQKFLHKEAAAAAIGLINSAGALGSFAGPIVVGSLLSYTGSFIAGVYAMALFSLLAGVVMLLVKRK